MRGKKELDLAVDPPPDLAIEVDISRSSLNKLSIYADIGVPEVWLYDGQSRSGRTSFNPTAATSYKARVAGFRSSSPGLGAVLEKFDPLGETAWISCSFLCLGLESITAMWPAIGQRKTVICAA